MSGTLHTDSHLVSVHVFQAMGQGIEGSAFCLSFSGLNVSRRRSRGREGGTVLNARGPCRSEMDLHLVRPRRGHAADGTFTNCFLVVREYQCTEDEDGPLCEDQVSSDAETIQFGDDEDPSTALAAGKRRGWGHTLLDVMQNAVQKRQKEQKKAHSTLPRTSLSLPPIRLGHRPPGLKRPGSRESIIKWQGAGDG